MIVGTKFQPKLKILIFLNQICLKRVSPVKNIKSEHQHWILDIWISLGFQFQLKLTILHCAKNFRIRSYSGPYFPPFGLNTVRYSVSLLIQSESGKIRTRITPNMDTFMQCWVFGPNFPKNSISSLKQKKWTPPLNSAYSN